MKLRTTIYVYTSVVFMVLLLLFNAFIYILFDRMSINTQLHRAEAEANAIVEGVRKAADYVAPDDLLRAFVPAEGMLRHVRASGEKTEVTSGSETRLSGLGAAYHPNKVSQVIQVEGDRYVFVSMPVIWTDGEVVNIQITESLASTDNNLRVLRNVLFSVTLAALIAVIISSRLLSGIIIRPISKMIDTMKDIEHGGGFKSIDLQKKSKDELFEMGDTFNRMIDRLEMNYEKQEQFVSNASHELKTPLTVIESYASLLKRRGAERPELFNESVEAIHSEAVRMREMTEQLLLMARQTESEGVRLESCNIAEMTRDTARSYQTAYRREVNVHMEEDENQLYAITDLNKAKQLLIIFLDNARKYSEKEMDIHVEKEDRHIKVSIRDYGVGMSESELSKVFDRFYRVDQARTRKQGGSGLGLSLAKEIADHIQAEIQLTSSLGEGTTAIIRFPSFLSKIS
ncbi:TPA: HAMP domain-containing histidine kinase [Enterococcus faecium]|nr:HAMP domain-containing histidine kinase [Neobacillus mesonae]HDT7699226.1 HAMP domain-containing histidine kinase [Enterococcus faecium]